MKSKREQRRYYAGAALTGLLAAVPTEHHATLGLRSIAHRAWDIADAMMLEELVFERTPQAPFNADAHIAALVSRLDAVTAELEHFKKKTAEV